MQILKFGGSSLANASAIQHVAQLTNDDFTLLEHLSYDKALHLAERGAKVLHPGTLQPLREKNIILRIRNTFRPEHSGTRIGPAVRAAMRPAMQSAAS